MAHVAPIYPNFARGEVSPLMFGRIDIEQYPSCLDKCRNTYIRPYGCATRLTGTEYVSSSKNSGKIRLLKFVFSATDSYIIECGAGYFRFYQNGAPVLKSSAPAWQHSGYSKGDFVTNDGVMYYCVETFLPIPLQTFEGELEAGYWVEQNIYEIPNSYTEAQLSSIQYVQLDDIIKLTCLPDGANSTAKPKELVRRASDDWTFRNVTFKETPYLDQNTTDITMKPSAVTGSITIEASSAYFNANMVGANMWIGTKVKDTDTNKDVQGFVKITSYTDSTHVDATVKSKLSGTTATKLWGEGAFSNYRGYPSCVALYDGRLWYGRTPTQPRNIYGSKPYAYETFTPAVDNEDDAGINVQLATNANGDGSDIKWMIGGSYLLCGTYGGEFVIRGTGDAAITATDISAKQRTNWGGEPIQPIVAGTFVHFIQRNGNKLRQFQYDYYYDAYKAVDVSIFSEHLLESPIIEMALQKNPDSIIYLLRKDGNVVMLTLEQDQSVQAWSLLEDMGAEVESIQTIPSFNGNYDEVYMVMKRSALETVLTYTCTDPNLTITDNYNGLRETAGVEVVELTYDASHGVWTTPTSTALNTTLTVTSSNVAVVPTTYYYGTKTSVGTITEVLEYDSTNISYVLDGGLTAVNTPSFDNTTGEASFTNGYYGCNYNIENGLVVKFTTTSDINSNQIILMSDNQMIKMLTVGNNKLQIRFWQHSFDVNITANTTYWVKLEKTAGGYEVSVSTDGDTYTSLGTGQLRRSIVSYIGANGLEATERNPKLEAFKGTIDFSETIIYNQNGFTRLAKAINEWFSQTTGQTVDLSSYNYEIMYTGTPVDGDTLTCVWNTISGAVDPADYKLTITGTPADEAVITLTYTSAYTAVARYIERMQNPVTPENQNEWWYVRSGLKYNGFELTKGNDLTLSANSGTITATADSSIFTSSMVGNRIRFIDSDYNILGEGEITAYTSGTVVTLSVTTHFQSLDLDGGQWGISTDAVSGLDHLNGRTVQVYADCKEQATKIVDNGSIDIDDAFIAVVGLPYTSYITTMPMEAGSQNGTAVGKRKRISEMAIRVWNSIGVRVGRDLENLYDTIYQQQKPFTGVIPNIKYNQGWVWDANITVEQSHPYPMNILSIAPIVTEVDK